MRYFHITVRQNDVHPDDVMDVASKYDAMLVSIDEIDTLELSLEERNACQNKMTAYQLRVRAEDHESAKTHAHYILQLAQRRQFEPKYRELSELITAFAQGEEDITLACTRVENPDYDRHPEIVVYLPNASERGQHFLFRGDAGDVCCQMFEKYLGIKERD